MAKPPERPGLVDRVLDLLLWVVAGAVTWLAILWVIWPLIAAGQEAPTFTTTPTVVPADPCASSDAPTVGCSDPAGRVRVWANAAFSRQADRDHAPHVAYCESRNSPTARNPTSSATGLYQHLARLFPARSLAAYGTLLDIFDGWHSTLIAAWLVHRDGWRHWPNCGANAR